jgi:large subunit ribosomal protein L7/L12
VSGHTPRCGHCGAPLDLGKVVLGVLRCEFCGTVSPLGAGVGRVLARADFSAPQLTGFTMPGEKHSRREAGGERVFQYEGNGNNVWLLSSSESRYDDFEARLAFRLLWGDLDTTRFGLALRETPEGEYRAWVSTCGTACLAYQPAKGERAAFYGWSEHSAIRRAPGAPNELRVRLVGNRLEMWVNEVQLAALRDQKSLGSHGRVQIIACSKAPMAVAVTGLTISEPEGAVASIAPDARPSASRVALGGAEASVAGPLRYDVLLAGPGPSKIAVIKELRGITGLGLAEAKDLTDHVPSLVKADVAIAQARAIRTQLEDAGASVTLRPR